MQVSGTTQGFGAVVMSLIVIGDKQEVLMEQTSPYATNIY